jgi:predicted MFS family arabinose efflux permease
VFFATRKLVSESKQASTGRLDVGGAITVTASMLLTVYAIVNTQYLLFIPAIVIFAIFIALESTVKAPLMPLKLFKDRNLSLASIIGALWSAAMFSQFFLSSLYLQQVLHYDPLKVGLSFLGPDLIMAAFSLGWSAKIVLRFGVKKPLFVGLALCSLSLLLLTRAPVNGEFLKDVLPSMIVLGLGAGVAFNPMLMGAMANIKPEDSGIASGLTNTAFMMGGSVGLAVLSAVAASVTASYASSDPLLALNNGYHMAFWVGAIFAGLAALLALTLRIKKRQVEGRPR